MRPTHEEQTIEQCPTESVLDDSIAISTMSYEQHTKKGDLMRPTLLFNPVSQMKKQPVGCYGKTSQEQEQLP